MIVRKCNCGNMTHEKDGICVICKMKKKLEEPTMSENSIKKNEKKKYVYTCNREGCGNRRYKQGLCYKHYKEVAVNSSQSSEVRRESIPVRSEDWKERIKKVIYILERIPMQISPEQRADLVIETYEYLYEKEV